jgi:hypothetical protein
MLLRIKKRVVFIYLELHIKIENLNTEIGNNQNLAMKLLQSMKDQVEQVGEEKVRYI